MPERSGAHPSPRGGPGSAFRGRLKRILRPVLPDRIYSWLQAVAAVRDIRDGRWAEPELALVPVVVAPGEDVVDVGANFGLWSARLSRAVGASGTVHALEPVPYTAGVLRSVIRQMRLRNVRHYPVGASDVVGELNFVLPLQESGAPDAGLVHSTRVPLDSAEGVVHLSLEVQPLDRMLPDAADVSFMKLDIEGGEVAALLGARAVITRCAPTIVCEVNDDFLRRAGTSARALHDFMTAMGYSAYRWEPGDPPTLERIDAGWRGGVNQVFVHPRRADRVMALLDGQG